VFGLLIDKYPKETREKLRKLPALASRGAVVIKSLAACFDLLVVIISFASVSALFICLFVVLLAAFWSYSTLA
jgi:hypothetical protein